MKKKIPVLENEPVFHKIDMKKLKAAAKKAAKAFEEEERDLRKALYEEFLTTLARR
ncbi:MAG: hypothetical protein AAB373_00500 [Patescibacteria group bacterium]